MLPLVFLAWVVPLTRMRWKRSRACAVVWAVASLPVLAAEYLVAGTIGATWRPKRRRDWDGDCYREGGACWVHGHYPWLWAVGLAATLTVTVLLVALYARYGDEGSSPTPPSTSGPGAAPTPRSPSGTGGRRPPA
ncbi:hypothetical protein [Streptomyces sp. NPDC058766]|uniref:hypothetical protein n=1 Tax=Streptomyces sp. NPDC058766 TaxID=3346630 RepID=UPI0036BD608D